MLVIAAAAPDRPDRVDDVARSQSVTARDLRLPRLAAIECAAFFEKARPCRPVYRAIDTAATEQRRVGGTIASTSRAVISPTTTSSETPDALIAPLQPP